MDPDMMIEVAHLTKRFGSFCAVKNLSMNIPRGEIFAFLGPNGAGKTTTIKMMVGLLRPSEGSIRIAGLPMAHDAINAKRLIAYIPDMPYLYEHLTAEEFFRFTGDLYGVAKSRVDAELAASFQLFRIYESRNILIRDFSHGMRQRLIYCSSLLHEPAVFFIDEPLIGLDPQSIRMIKDLLRQKARDGMTIFLTTHILALAEDIADRIGIIAHGELLVVGTARELITKTGVDGGLEEAFLALTEKDGTA